MATYNASTHDNKCIFCEIVAGRMQTPGIFWENNDFMAFLSIDPNTEGFTCVIPKEHYESDVMKMPDAVLQRFIVASKEVTKILEKYYDDVGRVGIMMEGTGIDHAHIKLMPLHGTENLKKGIWEQFLSEKEFWFDKYEGWICSGGGPLADTEKLKALAEGLRKSQN
jgi:histidine triad (HIT) family protein